jgi:hypothetical protein
MTVKALSRLFYRFEVEWVGHKPRRPFHDARIGLLLNHTSLYEPIFFGILPSFWLFEACKRGILPGADSTLDRPLVGKFFKWIAADVVPVTRNRDRSWTQFVDKVSEESILLMAPEGRMKRLNGLDKHGRPMSLRGGIVDILHKKTEGTMLLLYSGGLHHVQAPGEPIPRLFQTVRAKLEEIPIEEYKKAMGHGTPEFRANVISDLERRRDLHCCEV